MTVMKDDDDLNREFTELARCAAAYAHRCCFSTRRGFLDSDPHLIVAYDNSPSSGESRRREWDISSLVTAADELGLTLLGEASYPIGGEDDGYTMALAWTWLGDIDQRDEIITTLHKRWTSILIGSDGDREYGKK